MQGLRVVVYTSAGLRIPQRTNSAATRRAQLGINQLSSAASLCIKAMQASICAISIYSSG